MKKYKKGKLIKSFDDLLKQEFVIMRGKTTHIAFIESMTVRTVYNMMQGNVLYTTIKQDKDIKESDNS